MMKQDLSASHGPPHVHKDLPAELWADILDLAAHIPRELGIAEWTRNYDRLELGRRGLDQLTAPTYFLKDGLKLRLRLSLVSRLWNKLMRKWLYQSVVIDNEDRLRSFHWLLKKSPEIAALFKRLDLSYESTLVDSSDIRESSFSKFRPKLFLEVLERCSNLLLVVDCSTSSTSSAAASSHPISYQNNKHGLSLYTTPLQQLMFTQYTLSMGQISESHFQHIRALQLPDITTYLSKSCPVLSLLKLEVLSVSELDSPPPKIDKLLSGWHLPRLHSITISIKGFMENPTRATFTKFWKKFGPQIRTLCIEDRRSSETGYSRYSHFFSFIAQYWQNLNMQSLEQLVVPLWMPEEILSTFTTSTIRAICVFWNYFPNLDHKLPPEAFVLRLVSQPTVFKLFPNLDSFHITCIPNLYPSPDDGDTYRSIYERRISDLVGYLDAHEDSIRDRGISIGLTMTDGSDIESAVELRRIYGQYPLEMER